MERTDSSYIAAAIKQKPRGDDPREIEIVRKIGHEVFRSRWAKYAFTEIKDLQIRYFKAALACMDKPEQIRGMTQEILQEISHILRAKITEGAEYLEKLPKKSPALICTNHFGAYKLTSFSPKDELGIDIEGYDWICPPFCHASLFPVSSALGNNLYFIVADFPAEFGALNTRAGFLHVPPPEAHTGRVAVLQNQMKNVVQRYPNAAVVNFPEGGTSGKYSGLGPYDLSRFKTGGYVIAALMKIPVIPVAQYFDKDGGFTLRVFEPFVPSISNRQGYERRAEKNRSEMQSWLDFCRSSSTLVGRKE